MQSEKMQVQLCPQLASIQTQLKTAIANHQMVFGSYQKDPENAVLRDKLEEMQVQIKNLSNHQKVLVQQLRGQLMQSTCVASTGPTATTFVTSAAHGTNTTPVIVTPSSVAAVAKTMGTLNPRPQLVTLQPHANVGIVVPFAHVQAQPTLMTLPGVLNQPNLQAAQTQSLVSLQLNTSSASPAAAILTPPTPVNTTSVCVPASKQNQICAPSVGTSVKSSQSVLRPIQPRPASPPIKVPQYTINHHSSNQGQHTASVKGAEKSNGILHRSFSESDAKDLKKNLDLTEKDPFKVKDEKGIDHKKKIDFMYCIGLVTHDASKMIQNKRVERKRRSTANPHYSYTVDSVRRRNGSNGNGSGSNWLMGAQPAKRSRGRSNKSSVSPGDSCPGSPDSQDVSGLDGAVLSDSKTEGCAVCSKVGHLLLCATCSLMYHLDCLSPPLASVPASPWSCPACIVSGKGNGTLNNGALSMVNSYITVKANKEDERRKVQRQKLELLQEKQNLLEQTKHLKELIEDKRTRCEKLTEELDHTSATVTTLDSFVKSFQDPHPPVSSS